MCEVNLSSVLLILTSLNDYFFLLPGAVGSQKVPLGPGDTAPGPLLGTLENGNNPRASGEELHQLQGTDSYIVLPVVDL